MPRISLSHKFKLLKVKVSKVISEIATCLVLFSIYDVTVNDFNFVSNKGNIQSAIMFEPMTQNGVLTNSEFRDSVLLLNMPELIVLSK
jgi:hypothetical protein